MQHQPLGGRARWINIVGVIFVTYAIATFDRVNLGLALPDMSRDLGLTPAQAGLAGGIFSWGYVVTFVAAGWLAPRVGPRRLVGLCLLCWGSAALLTGTAHSFAQLIAVRLLLGVAEGPVWTSAAMLTAQFFVKTERGRAFALWTLAAPLGALVAGPVSGLLLAAHDWRFMLVVEGLPALVWALVWYWRVPGSLDSAKWLSGVEREQIVAALREEQASLGQVEGGAWRSMLAEPIVWFLVSGFSLINLLVNGFTLWLPSAIKSASSYGMLSIGLLSALPWVADMVGIFVISRSSDRYQERRLHAAIPMILAGCLLLVAANVGTWSFAFQIALFTLMGFFVHMFLPLIFTYTTEVLPQKTAVVSSTLKMTQRQHIGFDPPG
ncbi:MFS transporter [Burkholderia multivorans]|uniref:MFS transporter n=1 Tax=Burkholderia multivorans TaxID=87883 RepID=UPI001C235B99|nr:MFS transporter [Burkholderia multivorans]MBU9363464.1 MFS transporter [Burkholderia multivorans]